MNLNVHSSISLFIMQATAQRCRAWKMIFHVPEGTDRDFSDSQLQKLEKLYSCSIEYAAPCNEGVAFYMVFPGQVSLNTLQRKCSDREEFFPINKNTIRTLKRKRDSELNKVLQEAQTLVTPPCPSKPWFSPRLTFDRLGRTYSPPKKIKKCIECGYQQLSSKETNPHVAGSWETFMIQLRNRERTHDQERKQFQRERLLFKEQAEAWNKAADCSCQLSLATDTINTLRTSFGLLPEEETEM